MESFGSVALLYTWVQAEQEGLEAAEKEVQWRRAKALEQKEEEEAKTKSLADAAAAAEAAAAAAATAAEEEANAAPSVEDEGARTAAGEAVRAKLAMVSVTNY